VVKVIKAKDLREMDDRRLTEYIVGLGKDLLAAKKALADGSLPNPRVISKAKKDIARAKTILNEKKTEAEEAAEREEK
jgi:ribosomal protein L29